MTDEQLLGLAQCEDFTPFVDVSSIRGLPKVQLVEMMNAIRKHLADYDESMAGSIKLSMLFTQYATALTGRIALSQEDREIITAHAQAEICRASLPIMETEIQRREAEDAKFASWKKKPSPSGDETPS